MRHKFYDYFFIGETAVVCMDSIYKETSIKGNHNIGTLALKVFRHYVGVIYARDMLNKYFYTNDTCSKVCTSIRIRKIYVQKFLFRDHCDQGSTISVC